MKRLNGIPEIILLFFGVALVFYQYSYNRSLWLDEASLALNVMERDPIGLLRPMDYGQVAPILFLQLANAVTVFLGENEYALRLIPLLAYLAALLLFYKVLRQLVSNNLAFIAGLSLFVFNQHLIFFSSEFKQYMSDVLVTVLLLYLVIHDGRSPKLKYGILVIAGAFSIFLSNISILLFTMVFPIFIMQAWLKKDRLAFSYTLISGGILSLVFLLYYFVFIRNHPLQAYMLDYWTRANGFIPTDLSDPATLKYLRLEFSNLFTHVGFQGHLLWKQLTPVSVALTVILLLAFLWHSLRTRSPLIMLIAPVFAHLILSYLKMYPNSTRLILYQFPLFMVMITLGLQVILNSLSVRKWIPELVIYLLVISSGLATITTKIPMGREEIKKTIRFVEAQVKPQDTIYLYHGAKTAFTYYQRSGFVRMDNPVIYGVSRTPDVKRYVDDIVSRKGNYWIVFSHIEKNEDKYILSELKKSGHLYTRSYMTTGSGAYYFTLR